MMLLKIILTVYLICNLSPAESKVSDKSSNKRSSGSRSNENLIVRLYLRGSSENAPTETCAGSCENITFKKLSSNKPVKILIHGWRGHEQCHFFKELLQEFLKVFDYNIITVDWSFLGSKDNLYPNARSKVPAVASKVAKFLNSLKAQSGIRLENVHIIGHSLGAHIAGIAAYQLSSGKIGRITGLDPAGPMFSEGAPKERLSTDSALLVDAIHTSANFLGFGGPLGHVDFYPNGPHLLQPGCGLDLAGRCSHRRSYHLYKESLSKPNAFPAAPCADWVQFQRRNCDMRRVVPMGEFTPTTSEKGPHECLPLGCNWRGVHHTDHWFHHLDNAFRRIHSLEIRLAR